MKTEAEFVAERMKAHREACAGLDEDPLYKLAQDVAKPAHEPVVIDPRERAQYCFPTGWVLRRQAG